MKKSIIALIAVMMVVVASAAGFAAEEAKTFKEATVDAGRAAVNYPANLVNETVNVVGGAAKGTTDVVVDTVKATGETLSGDTDKASEIVTTPINKSAETVKDATVGTVEAPVKAGEKTAEQN